MYAHTYTHTHRGGRDEFEELVNTVFFAIYSITIVGEE